MIGIRLLGTFFSFIAIGSAIYLLTEGIFFFVAIPCIILNTCYLWVMIVGLRDV